MQTIYPLKIQKVSHRLSIPSSTPLPGPLKTPAVPDAFFDVI